jgi:ribonuclease P protein component
MTGQTSAMVAFIIPKNCGPAVIRNRIRRRLKELFRHLQPHLPSDARIVWIAHPPAAQMTLAQLAIEFLRLVHRAGLMPRDQGYPPEVAHRWKISDSPRS